jgi:hypothetical protein
VTDPGEGGGVHGADQLGVTRAYVCPPNTTEGISTVAVRELAHRAVMQAKCTTISPRRATRNYHPANYQITRGFRHNQILASATNAHRDVGVEWYD